jgi:hypothetical protein
LDLNAGETPKVNGNALKAGSDRAKQQLLLAATLKNVNYDSATGALSFQIQNNTAHKLISGFPEGRRMFINIKAYNGGQLIHEVNPYDYTVGTLKGIDHSLSSPPLGPNETRVAELVYEIHPSSTLTGESKTFHFVLADGRYKDNRIPPKGFDISEAQSRLSEPVWDGVNDPNYFTADEYAGGYDDIDLNIASGADYVEINLYYQGTSREYVEFLRDEINGVQNLTLPGEAYIVKSDSFFDGFTAWGNVIWDLWFHNHGLDGSEVQIDGIVPFMMAQATIGVGGCAAPAPILDSATAGNGEVILIWSLESPDPSVVGYKVYYDQAGKAQFVADIDLTTTYVDSGLTNGQEYCYKVTSYYDATCKSGFSNILCATPTNQGQATDPAGVSELVTGYYSGKGGNKTFVTTNSLQAGDAVVIRALVVDENGVPIPNATVDVAIDGPEVTSLTSGPSDSEGWAEATWNTQKPNKRGQGGTTPGTFTASVIDVTASGYHWNSVTTSATFEIQ